MAVRSIEQLHIWPLLLFEFRIISIPELLPMFTFTDNLLTVFKKFSCEELDNSLIWFYCRAMHLRFCSSKFKLFGNTKNVEIKNKKFQIVEKECSQVWLILKLIGPS